jgi:hypothetical protein
MAIWCQFRNSVTPASGKEIPECDSESIEINDMIDLLSKVLKSLEDVRQKESFLKFMGLIASGTFPLPQELLLRCLQ